MRVPTVVERVKSPRPAPAPGGAKSSGASRVAAKAAPTRREDGFDPPGKTPAAEAMAVRPRVRDLLAGSPAFGKKR